MLLNLISIDVRTTYNRMPKTCRVTYYFCEMYVTSHKKPFVPSVEGTGYYVMDKQRVQSVLSNVCKGC